MKSMSTIKLSDELKLPFYFLSSLPMIQKYYKTITNIVGTRREIHWSTKLIIFRTSSLTVNVIFKFQKIRY